jgi:Pyrimidine dimer DNA glycosylase (EC 3.2.2.17)/DNA-(apurinic or apyrimidinic site) lyase (EC 4.2.99.18)
LRLWSLHPSFLDKQGILGVWREGLLAQKVLIGKTQAYVNHPQLIRFKKTSDPLLYIGTYLYFIYVEGSKRGYKFRRKKILKYDPKLINRGNYWAALF